MILQMKTKTLEMLTHRSDDSANNIWTSIITASVVIIGVVLAETLKRNNDRRNLIRHSTVALALKVPHVVVGMTATGQLTDTSMNSPWWQERENVMQLLITVVNNTYWPQLHRKEIRKSAEDLLARLTAAEMDFMLKNIKLNITESFEITGSDLTKAVFRRENNMEKEIEKYRKTSSKE